MDAGAQRRELDRGGDGGLRGCFLGDVGLAEQAADAGRDRLALRDIAVEQHDPNAFGGQAPARRLAHAGSPARNDCRSVLE